MVADLIRSRAIKNGTWFRRAISANYVRVAVACGLAGYAGLVLWGLAQVRALTPDGLLIDAPYALLAMATGGFYVYHLDNAEMHRRPSRLWEVGSQTIVTGMCGLIAASVSFELILGGAQDNGDGTGKINHYPFVSPGGGADFAVSKRAAVRVMLERNIGIEKYFSYIVIKSPFIKTHCPIERLFPQTQG